MTITFWGVRGSVSCPGPTTLRYGGNTACLSIETADRVLVIDAGTGIRGLGQQLRSTDKAIYVLLTHLHRDHLSGFPFFAPLYQANRPIHLLPYQDEAHNFSLLDLFDGVHFPLQADQLPATCEVVTQDALAYLRTQGFHLTALRMNHPGGAYGYRLDHEGQSFVFMPDNELSPPTEATPHEAFVAFCEGATYLCHDAQFVAADFPTKWGWGHSEVRQACRLAQESRVAHLILYHHDPQRTDDALDAIQADAQRWLEPYGIGCQAAYEGLTLTL